jgi:hypothetical protein
VAELERTGQLAKLQEAAERTVTDTEALGQHLPPARADCAALNNALGDRAERSLFLPPEE